MKTERSRRRAVLEAQLRKAWREGLVMATRYAQRIEALEHERDQLRERGDLWRSRYYDLAHRRGVEPDPDWTQ